MKILKIDGSNQTYAILSQEIDKEVETKTGLQERIYEVLLLNKLDFTQSDVIILEISGDGAQQAQEKELDSAQLHIHQFRRIVDGAIAADMKSYHIVPTKRTERLLDEAKSDLKKFR